MKDKYKIIWAGPWNVESAIAGFGLQIVEELKAMGHEVIIFRTETGKAKKIKPVEDKKSEVYFWNIERILKTEYDVIINNFGNHYPFHGAVLDDLSAFNRLNAVGILHDFFYCNIIAEWAHKKNEKEGTSVEDFLRNIIYNTYGDEIGFDFPFWRDLKIMAEKYPLVEFLSRNLAGAVCHSDHYIERVRSSCPGPVEKIPLCMKFEKLDGISGAGCLGSGLNLGSDSAGSVLSGADCGRALTLTVGVIGHGNPNKRLEQILSAIGGDEFLKNRYRFKLVGHIDDSYRSRLKNIAEKLSLIETEFTGWVSDEDLIAGLKDLDVLCCLREPILEGGSASLIFAMQSGRPTIVSDHGPYAELPDDCVFKCDIETEIEDIRKYLRWIYENYENALAYGIKARDFSLRRNSTEFYAKALISLVEETLYSIPVINAAKRIGDTLSGFGVKPDDDAAAERIGGIMDGLFGAGFSN